MSSNKKNIRTILRKDKKIVPVKKVPLRKPEPFDIRSFAFLVVILGLVIFIAIKLLTNSTINQENKSVAILQAGESDLDAGKIDDAAKKFEQVLQTDKNNQDAIFQLAIVKYNKKQYDGAIADISGVIAKNPQNSEGYNVLGNIYRDLKKTDEAMKNYRQAIEADQKNISPYANLAIMFMDVNNNSEARKVVTEGLKNIPDSPELKNLQNIIGK